MLISKDYLDSLHETLFWLSQDGIHEDVASAREQEESGSLHKAADVRARYGLSPR